VDHWGYYHHVVTYCLIPPNHLLDIPMTSYWDEPMDPKGDAYTAFVGDDRFRYAMIVRHKIFYTNSKKRFKRHYRLCRRRWTPGTWFKKDDFGIYRFWRMILSPGVL
jgi:hypothetical protein